MNTGLPLRAVPVLVHEERVDRRAGLQHLDVRAHAARNDARQDPLRRRVLAEDGLMRTSSFVLCAAVKSAVPAQARRARRSSTRVLSVELQARVLHAADVRRQEVRQVRPGRDRAR